MGREDFTSSHPSRSLWAPTEAFPCERWTERLSPETAFQLNVSTRTLLLNERILLPLGSFCLLSPLILPQCPVLTRVKCCKGRHLCPPFVSEYRNEVPKELQFPEEISFQGKEWMMLGTNQRSLPLKKRCHTAVVPYPPFRQTETRPWWVSHGQHHPLETIARWDTPLALYSNLTLTSGPRQLIWGVTRHLQSVPLPKAATSNYSPGFSLLSLQLAYWWDCQGSGSDPNNPSNACSGGRDEPVPGVDLTSFPVQKAKQTQSEWLSLSSSQCSPSNCRDLEEHPVRENIKHHV